MEIEPLYVEGFQSGAMFVIRWLRDHLGGVELNALLDDIERDLKGDDDE
jgi:hypothetical protein